MNEQQQSLDALKDIRNMMERSSRFISLSGWSGVSAGLCALAGAWLARGYISGLHPAPARAHNGYTSVAGDLARPLSLLTMLLSDRLLQLAAFTFAAAFASAFIFTYIKSKKQGIPLMGKTSTRLMISVAIPMIAGGLFVLRLIQLQAYGLIAPACLLFYGLSLLNASKYTFDEIRWLGMFQLGLGIINCWYPGYGLYFWAMGFGIMHIIYGMAMWWKYEKNSIN